MGDGKVGHLVPRPAACPDCNGGRVSMAECEKCAGTGTIFRVKGEIFPDTKDGYDQAERKLNV